LLTLHNSQLLLVQFKNQFAPTSFTSYNAPAPLYITCSYSPHLQIATSALIIPMKTFKTHKACILFSLLIFLSSSVFPSESLPLAAGTIERTAKQQAPAASLPPSHETAPTSASSQPSGLLVDPALSPPISNKKPSSAESLDSQEGESEAGNQQETGYPQQGRNQPLSGFNQPFSSTNQPLSGFNQPFSSTNQPLSGFNQPFSSTRQPFSGFNQPYSSLNQPFGSNNQQGLVNNSPLDNGVSEEKAFVLGVVLVSLITFGFLV